MAMAKYEYEKMLSVQNEDIRNKVLDGVDQIKKGKTKDFNGVCERLEKKYENEGIPD